MAGRELGAGAWWYSGIRARSRTPATRSRAGYRRPAMCLGARLTKGGRLSKHLLFRGLGRDDHNNLARLHEDEAAVRAPVGAI